MDWLDTVYWGNSVRAWLSAAGVIILSFLVLQVFIRVFVRRLAKAALATRNDLDDFLADFFGRTRFYFSLALSAYLAIQFLELPEQTHLIIESGVIVVTLVQVGFWGLSLINYLLKRKAIADAADGVADPHEKTSLNAVGMVARIVLWSVIVLLILENVTGVKVDTLIASLGIGGIAVALAVQNILGDLFSALTIALDKPFMIGDFINVGEFSGEIENVGLKSTRVRSLTGEQLVFSNSDLLGSRIRNFKRMQRRRVAYTIGVTYQTPAAKLAAIPKMLQAIIEKHEQVTFDRVHLSKLGDFAIQFDVVYFMEVPDFLLFMDNQQSMNLEILERFEEEGIEFAYPTQTLIVEKGG